MRLLLIVLAGLIACMPFASPATALEDTPVWWQRAQKEASSDGYKLTSASEVAVLIKKGGDFVMLDVRPDYEYDQGHIPGAQNLEFHLGDRLGLKPEKAAALANIVGPDKSRKLIIYCRSFKCLRSAIAAKWAAQEGYKNVYRFVPGGHAWLEHTGQSLGQGPAGPGVGDYFPSCRLVVLGGDSDRDYLGLPAKSKAFDLGEIKAEFLFVEFYHQLCYGCLREVASYNALFNKVKSDPFLKQRLKMLGLGVGSLLREVRKFRRKEGVLFPLFADQNKDVFRCLGEPSLPIAYVLGRNSNGRLKILRILPGHIGEMDQVLSEIKAAVATAVP